MKVILEKVGYIFELLVFGEVLNIFTDNSFEPLTHTEVNESCYRNKIKFNLLYERYDQNKIEKYNLCVIVAHADIHVICGCCRYVPH